MAKDERRSALRPARPTVQSLIYIPLLALIFEFFVLVYHLFHCYIFPYPLDAVDGESLAREILVRQGANPFSAVDLYRMPPPFYPPLYYVLLSFLPRFANPFGAARLLNATALIIIFFALYLQRHGNRVSRILCALLFVTNLAVYQWAQAHSPDLLMIAFGALALSIASARSDWFGAVTAGVAGALALHTKQTASPILLASAVVLLISGGYLSALRFAASCALGSALLLTLYGKGGFYFITAAVPIVFETASSLASFEIHLLSFVRDNLGLVLAALVALLVVFRADDRGKERFLPIVYFFACCISFLGFVNNGANVNYFLVPVFFFVMILRDAFATVQSRAFLLTAFVLLILHAGIQFRIPNHWTSRRDTRPPTSSTPLESDRLAFEELGAILAREKGLIFPVELGVVAATTGQYYPSVWSLASFGTAGFISDLENGKYSAMVIERESSMGKDWFDLVQEHYSGSLRFIKTFDLMGRTPYEFWELRKPKTDG